MKKLLSHGVHCTGRLSSSSLMVCVYEQVSRPFHVISLALRFFGTYAPRNGGQRWARGGLEAWGSVQSGRLKLGTGEKGLSLQSILVLC